MSLGFPQTSYPPGGGSGTAHFPTGQPYSPWGPQPPLIPNFVTLGHVRENIVLRSSPAESPSKASEPLSAPHEMIKIASLARGDVPPPEDALPPGWEVGQDQTGNEYFYNKELNVTQWNRPAAAGLGSQVPVAEMSHIQKCKTAEICRIISLEKTDKVENLNPDELSHQRQDLDLLRWLELDVLSIQSKSVVELILCRQEVRDNFLELVLESSTPLLVSVRYAGAFQNYASRKRSEDMRMADAADEKAAALEQLACAIAREKNFASLLTLSSSTLFKDLKHDASSAKKLFHEEVTEALRLATFFKLKKFVSEPLMVQLVRNQWNLMKGYYPTSPACRFWFHKITYVILCYVAWSLPPFRSDQTDESGAGITNRALTTLEVIAAALLVGHTWSCYRQLNILNIRRLSSLSRRKLVKDSSEPDELREASGGDQLINFIRNPRVWMESAFIGVAIGAAGERYSPDGDPEYVANVYLFTMVMWWARIGTILHVFRFSGRQNVFV
jgi:hypothetical protein